MRHLLAASFIVLASGCSIMDPGDRQELRDRIRALPQGVLSMLTTRQLNSEAYKWMLTRDDADQVGKIQCRTLTDGEWGDWADQDPPFLVFDMKDCLLQGPYLMTYMLCAQEFASVHTQMKAGELKNSLPGVTNAECKYVWDWRYDPDRVPPELIEYGSVSIDDIIDLLVSLPEPPPGWAFPELAPLLCPLGAGPGWGCPSNPDDPTGDQPTTPTGGSSGDHP